MILLLLVLCHIHFLIGPPPPSPPLHTHFFHYFITVTLCTFGSPVIWLEMGKKENRGLQNTSEPVALPHPVWGHVTQINNVPSLVFHSVLFNPPSPAPLPLPQVQRPSIPTFSQSSCGETQQSIDAFWVWRSACILFQWGGVGGWRGLLKGFRR